MKLKTIPTEDGKRIRIDFTYSAAVVALVKTIPGAKFEWGSKTWTVAKRYHAKVDAFLVAAKPILEAEEKAAKEAERQAEIIAERNCILQREARRQERAEYLAQCDRAREAKAEADRAAGKGRFGTLVENAPREGTVLRRGDEVVRVTGLGKVFRLSDDASSIGWPCGHEGERACYAYYERATPDEVAALETREAEAKRVVEIRRRQREAIETVKMSDDRPEVGHVPEGEILWKDERHRATGWASHVVLTADGWIWHAQYDGTDGGAWGDYNLGYNTWGGRVPATPELIAAIRGEGMET